MSGLECRDDQGAASHRARTMSLCLVVVASQALVPAVTGCGGRETTASRSAAAFDQQQGKGGDEAGQRGHVATARKPASPASVMTQEHAGHEGHDTGPATPGAPSRAGAHTSHSSPTHAAPSSDPHAGHRAASPAPRQPVTDAAADPHSGHAGLSKGAGAPEPASAIATPGQAGATLRPDPLDVPAATSMAEAARAEQVLEGGHHMNHGVYTHLDAGRASTPTPGTHHDHQHPRAVPTSPSPRPSPSPKDNR